MPNRLWAFLIIIAAVAGVAQTFQSGAVTINAMAQGMFDGAKTGVEMSIGLAVSGGVQAWARLQAAASLPGVDVASFRSPGYGVLGVDLESDVSATGSRWGVSVQNLADKRYVRGLTGADNV